jgi:hypothetical protein
VLCTAVLADMGTEPLSHREQSGATVSEPQRSVRGYRRLGFRLLQLQAFWRVQEEGEGNLSGFCGLSTDGV